MAESDRRQGYRYNRVLIETERILDPQFADALVFLSGAQIEMLRNITQYLNRRDTYASERFLGYYLAPTIADYDEILEIVADLEESLMGNPNTIWGYKERWSEKKTGTSTGEASTGINCDAVPEGYVYVLEYWDIEQKGDTAHALSLRVFGGDAQPTLFYAASQPSGQAEFQPCHIILSEGDLIQLRAYGLEDTKTCIMQLRGYMMAVPAE